MAPIIYEIDPNADTVIVLKNACTSFAEWDPVPAAEEAASAVEEVEAKERARLQEEAQQHYLAPSSTNSSKKKKKKDVAAECVPEPVVEVSEFDWGLAFSGSSKKKKKKKGAFEYAPEPALGPEPEPWPARLEPKPEGVELEDKAEPEPVVEREEFEEDGVYYYVSSRHLMLASPWFKRALTKDSWIESGRANIDGRFHITAEDWDAEAFLIVLRIFHLRNKQVPRTVTLDMLAKIAILVDYYDCGEALELFTEMWIKHLRKSALPSVYGRDLVLWVWVSWLFGFADEFKRATATAIKHSSESIRTLELPIPMRVSDKIDSERYQAIDSAMDGVHGLLDKYRKASYVCPTSSTASYQCGSFLLGALTKELDRLEFFNPRPQSPFLGLSFDGLCEKLHTIQPPVLSIRDNYNHYQHHACALGKAVVMVVSMAEVAIVGLDLKSIKKDKGKVKA